MKVNPNSYYIVEFKNEASPGIATHINNRMSFKSKDSAEIYMNNNVYHDWTGARVMTGQEILDTQSHLADGVVSSEQPDWAKKLGAVPEAHNSEEAKQIVLKRFPEAFAIKEDVLHALFYIVWRGEKIGRGISEASAWVDALKNVNKTTPLSMDERIE